MISFLYTLAIHVFYVVIWLAQVFNPKAKKWITGRKNYWENLPETGNRKVIWFHCASLGEFDQGLPLMSHLKSEDPTIFLVVTFFSPSGMEHYHKRNAAVDFAAYLPSDTMSNAKKFIRHFRPQTAYFIKYEFWYHFIKEAKVNGVKLYSVCAIFRKDHRFFKWYGGFFRRSLRLFDHFFVQTKESVELLRSIGLTKVTLVGDMRFDRVIENKKNSVKDEVVVQFLGDQKAFIVGSSWTVDETFLEGFITSYIQDGKVIIAPHDIKENHLLEIERRFAGKVVRYSKFEKDKTTGTILLIDSIGKLSNLYQYGYFAYIGGGFTGSLHNILEPAVFGLPVIFGPKHKRFPEATLFIEDEVGFEVSSPENLEGTVERIVGDYFEIKRRLNELIQKQAGAVHKIISEINSNATK